MEYVFTEQPTDVLGAADEWPDPLPPLREAVTLPRNRNYPVWVTVHVPAGTPAGDYAGALTLTAEGVSQHIPLRVHVWGFDLPKETHLRSGFGLGRNMIKTYHHLATEQQKQQVWELYLRDFARHRVNPYSVGHDMQVTWDKGGDGNSRRGSTSPAFDRDAHFALDELGFNSFVIDLQGMGGGTFYSRAASQARRVRGGDAGIRGRLQRLPGRCKRTWKRRAG